LRAMRWRLRIMSSSILLSRIAARRVLKG
jgi:hypothetical protein